MCRAGGGKNDFAKTTPCKVGNLGRDAVSRETKCPCLKRRAKARRRRARSLGAQRSKPAPISLEAVWIASFYERLLMRDRKHTDHLDGCAFRLASGNGRRDRSGSHLFHVKRPEPPPDEAPGKLAGPAMTAPDCASLHPGYEAGTSKESAFHVKQKKWNKR